MVDVAQYTPEVPVFEKDDCARLAVALASLVTLFVGLVGLVFSLPTVSALGLFLFALFGFGSAVLISSGVRGGQLLALSSPLGLALTLIAGGSMVELGVWVIGVPLYWVAAVLSGAVHLRVILRAFRNGTIDLGALWSRFLALRKSVGGASYADVLMKRRPNFALIEIGMVGVGLAACLVSALEIRHLDPGWSGLLGAISPAWFVGLTLIAMAIFLGQRYSPLLAGVPVIALQLVLTGSPAIVYNDPRYAWTANHVGVTAYVLLHGSVNPSIDIYQAWPGLFAGVAWLCRVSHFASPLGVARWWPPLIDFATLLAMYQLSSRVLRNPRRAWLAATIFVLGYAIGDADYYSPQSAAFLMAIATFAIVFRHRNERLAMTTWNWVALFALSLADAITHQLTPYMVTVALVVLVIFKCVKTRWAPVISIVPPVAWALVHFSYVTQHVSWQELLNPFANVLTPGISGGGPSPGALANTVRLFQGGSALLIGILALAALVRYRSSLNLALAVCAASAGSLVLVNSYGNEAAFRVVVFALPWLAILAGSGSVTRRLWSSVLWRVVVFALLPMYLVADMGLDFAYAMRPGDIQAERDFEVNAPVGSYLIVIGLSASNPNNISGRYDVVNKTTYTKIVGANFAHPISAAASYRQFMAHLASTVRSVPSPVVGNSPAYYVLTAQQPAAYMAAYNYATLKQYSAFEHEFASSSSWKLVLQTSTAHLFRLRNGSSALP